MSRQSHGALRSLGHSWHLAAVLLIATLTAGSCRDSVTVPPLTDEPTVAFRNGEFVWYDLLTDDLESAQSFYGELLGWTFDEIKDGVYLVAREGGVPVAGLIGADRVEAGVSSTRWVSYASVSDVDALVDTFRRHGGRVFAEPRDVPDRGRVAVVADEEGAVVALIEASGGDPPRTEPVVNRWLWTELWSADPGKAAHFYTQVGGYSIEAFDPPWDRADGVDYLVLKLGDRPVAGVLQNPYADVQPNWLPYVLVSDPLVTARRAEELGGQVLLAPDAAVRAGSMGILADPSGGAFAVQKWPPDAGKEAGRTEDEG